MFQWRGFSLPVFDDFVHPRIASSFAGQDWQLRWRAGLARQDQQFSLQSESRYGENFENRPHHVLVDDPGTFNAPPPTIAPGTGGWIWTNHNGDTSYGDSISSSGQIDYYRFFANKGGNHTISVSAPSLDSQLRIYDGNGNAITMVIDDPANPHFVETATVNLAENSWYYVAVSGYNTSTGSYSLSINGPTPFINDISTPGPNYIGQYLGGAVSPAGDIDWFRLVAPSGTNLLTLTVDPSPGLDTLIQLLNSSGSPVLSSVIDSGGPGAVDSGSASISAGATYYVGVTGLQSGSYDFTADFGPNQGDTTAPTLSGTAPSDNATSVAVGTNITMTFNEAVKAGSGNIEIRRGSDGSLFKSISVTDTSQVTFSGSTMTINPTGDLASATGYYVKLASGVVKDIAGNSYAGISSSTAFNFTTASVALQPGEALVTEAVRHLSEEYFKSDPDNRPTLADYNDPNFTGPWDCAELVSWCVHDVYGQKLGIRLNSNPWDAYTQQWRIESDNPSLLTKIDVETAHDTPGAILIRRGTGSTHIFISEGNGRLIEANVTSLGGYFWDDQGQPQPTNSLATDIGDVREQVFDTAIFTDADYIAVEIANGVSYTTTPAHVVTGGDNQNNLLNGTSKYDVIRGASGADVLNGNGGDDWLAGGFGGDALNGGADRDTFTYYRVEDSTSRKYDTIVGADFARQDVINLPPGVQVLFVDTDVSTGALSSGANFDSLLSSAVNAAHLGKHHAVLFTPNSGTLAGNHFLVVDCNGVAGYQASADIVICLQGISESGLSFLDKEDFI